MTSATLCDIEQRDLARRVGIHESQISRYFRGHQVPSLRIATRIALALSITLDELAEYLESVAA